MNTKTFNSGQYFLIMLCHGFYHSLEFELNVIGRVANFQKSGTSYTHVGRMRLRSLHLQCLIN